MRRSPALLALAGLAALLRPAHAGAQTRPNHVILITLDAARADHFSCYGYARRTTPFIDRLAAEGARFQNATAQAPWTVPSLATLWTSNYPEVHGADGSIGLSKDFPTFIRHLRQNGYETAAFVHGLPANPDLGLTKDFEHVESPGSSQDIGDLLEAAAGWIASRREKPFLVWIHGFETHFPYMCPEPFRDQYDPEYRGPVHGLDIDRDSELGGRFVEYFNSPEALKLDPSLRYEHGLLSAVERLRRSPRDVAHFTAHYDGCLNYADRRIEAFYGKLRDGGLAENAVWIVSADHGEYLGQAIGRRPALLSHPSENLYQDLLRVPLILRHPSLWRGRVVEDPVMILDLAPTLSSLLDLPPPPGARGESLEPWLDGRRAASPHPSIYSSSFSSTRRLWSLRSGDWKLMLDMHGWHLFDLKADPLEQKDLSDREPGVLTDLARRRVDMESGVLAR
jgi:arylsulfatase A-like enzyme